MNSPRPKPGILDIQPYVPGESKAEGQGETIKLSSNETPLGPSPKAVEAYRAEGSHLERYPDGSAAVLRHAIAGVYGLNAERIVCGAGSDELLNLIANAYLGPGDEAIYTEHGFLVYRIAILANGATPIIAPERNYTADVDEILERVGPRTRVVFVANPNNPTGTFLAIDEVRRLHEGLPGDVLLVLDAAYAEYVRRNDYEAGIELVATNENVVMTRTFSKVHGLAALRLGWAYCPAGVADVLNRIRGPFNVSSAAIAAGVAAITDSSHVEAAVVQNARELERLSRELRGLGLEVTPSVANFILVHFPDEGGQRATDCDAYLKSRGIVVRQVGVYGLANALRMTVGNPSDNEAVIAAVRSFRERGAT